MIVSLPNSNRVPTGLKFLHLIGSKCVIVNQMTKINAPNIITKYKIVYIYMIFSRENNEI